MTKAEALARCLEYEQERDCYVRMIEELRKQCDEEMGYRITSELFASVVPHGTNGKV